MAAIRFVRPEDKRFETVEELVERGACPQETYDNMEAGERQASTFIHHPGSAEEPQLIELRMPPDTEVTAHAHANHEIMVVTQGEMTFGAQRCPAGSTVYIPEMTLYSFRTGSEGVTFLNFRRTNDTTYIPKAQLLASRASG